MRLLYLWDAVGEPDQEQADAALRLKTDDEAGLEVEGEAGAKLRSLAVEMARLAWEARDVSDRRLEFHAPAWPVRRQPATDRAILRLAVWELGSGRVPPKVVIDEAVELAKQYGTSDSPAFVNGVLDAIYRENEALRAGGVSGLQKASPG